MNSKTVGAAATDLLSKEAPTHDPIELEREMHRDYEANIMEAVERGKKDFGGVFYVVVITKKERLLENVLRNYFFCRSSCPTPEWDQTVYQYNNSDENLKLLWVVPSKDTCEMFRQNAMQIAPEERDLLRYVVAFEDGTLYRQSKKLNNESAESPLLAE